MTDTIAVALIAGVPPTLLGTATLISTIKNGAKSEQIHILVNSKMTEVRDQLKAALKKVEDLEARLKH